MKTLAAVLIAMIVVVTASAETWKQKVERLERENRSLKTQVAALTKQVVKLQKENNELTGDQEVPKEKPVKKVETSTDKSIKKLEAERKKLKHKLEQNYRFNNRAERKAKSQLIERIGQIEWNLRELKKEKARKESRQSIGF